MSFRSLASLALLASVALAKTDLSGCTSSDSVVTPSNGGTPYATRVWYVPDTGEICAALDCGGGRAPPKTTVPGCPQYSGTDSYSPSFLPLKTSAPATDKSATAKATGSTTAAPTVTGTGTGTASASASGSETAKDDSSTLATVTSSATEGVTGKADNSTVTATTSRQASRSGGASGTRATTASTSVPNAAAGGASKEVFGLVAGLALGAAVLL